MGISRSSPSRAGASGLSSISADMDSLSRLPSSASSPLPSFLDIYMFRLISYVAPTAARSRRRSNSPASAK